MNSFYIGSVFIFNSRKYFSIVTFIVLIIMVRTFLTVQTQSITNTNATNIKNLFQ